jgi:hypothetical protein
VELSLALVALLNRKRKKEKGKCIKKSRTKKKEKKSEVLASFCVLCAWYMSLACLN